MAAMAAMAVEVHLVPVGPGVVAPAELLDDGERVAASRIRRDHDREAYVVAHAARRVLLGRRLGIDPASVRFGTERCPVCGGDDHGRPVVIGSGAEVSLSRAEGLVAVALGPPGVAIGVDVEPVARATADLTAALAPDEVSADPVARLRAWVRKEAHLKATGTGLGVDPATVVVGTGAAPLPVRVGWSLVDLDAGASHLAALAAAAPALAATVLVSRVADLLR